MANPNPNPNPHQVSLGTAGSQFFVVASHLSPRSLILDRTRGAEGNGDLQVPSRRHPIVRVGPEGFSEAAWHGAAKLIWGDGAATTATATTATAATATDQAAEWAAEQAAAAADAAPAVAEPELCASWCAAHEAAWSEKCYWGKRPCLGCLECTDALQPLVQPVGAASRTSLLAVGSRSTLPSPAAAQPAAAAAAAAAAGRSSAGSGELYQVWEVFHEATWSSWLALCARQAFGRVRRAGNPYADAIT